MRITPSVTPIQPVWVLDEVALVVGLEEPRDEPELGRLGGDPLLELGVAERTVERRIAPAQLIEVDAVHHLDPVVKHGLGHRASSLTAAATSGWDTGQPVRTAPGASSNTNGTGPSPQPLLVALGREHDLVRVGVVERGREARSAEQLRDLLAQPVLA